METPVRYPDKSGNKIKQHISQPPLCLRVFFLMVKLQMTFIHQEYLPSMHFQRRRLLFQQLQNLQWCPNLPHGWPLKRQENLHLKMTELFMSSAEYSCKLFKPIFAYRKTVWTQIRLFLKEQSNLSPHCLQKWLLKSQADDKADDNCWGLRCGWQWPWRWWWWWWWLSETYIPYMTILLY